MAGRRRQGQRRRRADHPARHAARADRERRGRRPEVRRRRPLRRRAALRHRQRHGRGQADGRPHRRLRAEGRLLRRADLGRRRRRLGDGLGATTASASSTQVRKACAIGQQMREIGIRPTGGIRIDSSTGVEAWDKDPKGNTKLIAETFREAGDDRRRITASSSSPRARSAGAACIPGARCVKLLEAVDMPGVVGYQADMAHSMLYTLGYNAEQDRILPEDYDWKDTVDARRRLQDRSPMRCGRGRSISTSRRTTARCSAPATTRRPAATARSTDPNGKLDIVEARRLLAARRQGRPDQDHAPHLLGRLHVPERGDGGAGRPGTTILGAMIKVRDAHGWRE